MGMFQISGEVIKFDLSYYATRKVLATCELAHPNVCKEALERDKTSLKKGSGFQCLSLPKAPLYDKALARSTISSDVRSGILTERHQKVCRSGNIDIFSHRKVN